MLSLAFLAPLHKYRDVALVLIRLVAGAFLMWGVWDNIVSAERMHEFATFMAGYGFPEPQILAPLSVWAQFLVGASFVSGLFARWAGIVCAINFIVAITMVDVHGGIRAMFPSATLIVIGLYLATNGAGRFSLDRLVENALRRGGHSDRQ